MEDLPELLALYERARAFMAANGNPTQWGTSSPPRRVLEEDIRKKQLFICERNRGVCGAFALVFGDDPTYARIEGGAWRSDSPYGTIHRIAGKETERGIFEECLSWCRQQTGHIRIDTHEKNAVMRHLIEKNGFIRCGIIHVADGSPRIAYEWTAGGGEAYREKKDSR
ncbi:MAG TPA: N-acetyltransferase [Candidatus Eisenbergiella stercorigallinarum]|uniref:N-acetyltransferase n=1 Tax=Candidatus Eisenbergiella stercorigallinarum TaxID=2838557 RepID=A0A9D2TZE3_9FIRM|nr:N-acetyltransferase [Candidatus Eisenbergiella stercorigallinarum]